MPSILDQFHLSPGLLIVGAVFVLVLCVAAAIVIGRGSKSWQARIQAKPLMTANEMQFFQRLQQSLPGHLVFPQVSFAAFLTDDGKRPGQKRWVVRSRFDRKIADFVVCDRQSLTIIDIVELDDRTHTASADRQRDEITKAGGYQTIRFRSRQKPSEAEIAERFRHSAALAVSKAS